LENCLFLINKGVKLIVIACNTSSSIALDYLRRFFKVPILGVIESQVELALNLTRNGRIGVIGTPSTIKSGAYERRLRSYSKNIRVYSQACPLFVPLVEEGLINSPITRLSVEMYLKTLKRRGIDTLILACTHYPLLKGQISRFLGSKVRLVDASLSIVKDVREVFEANFAFSRVKGKQVHQLFVTDDLEGFEKKSRIILGKDYKNIEVKIRRIDVHSES